jgi:ribosomal protein L11 methyltransferase
MDWLELSTRAEAEAVEAIAEVFARWGQGVAIEEPVVNTPDDTYHPDASQPVRVATYLPLDEQAAERQQRIEQALYWLGRLRPIAPLTTRRLAEADWETAWKQYFHVQHVGQRLVIVPSWRRYRPRPGEVVLALDPGMAFGTGLHPTTRLCLRLLERYLQPGARVLDLGTGSGILAIAAAKLGARRVHAIDTDATAVRVAQENVARNGVDAWVTVQHGDATLLAPAEPYDLVLANINLRVIRTLLPDLPAHLTPAGLAILSGVLHEHAPALRAAIAAAGLCWRARRGARDRLAVVVGRT